MEENYCNIVQEIFGEYQDKSIIIYGTGKIAQRLVERLGNGNFRVVGILDRIQKKGVFCGYKILSWNDVGSVSGGVVIIAAARRNYKEIYLRIREKCAFHDLKILGAWGEKLSNYPWADCDYKEIGRYCRKTKRELEEKIQEYEVISFDVFDTLIMRYVLEPNDVLEIVCDRIKKKNVYIPDFVNVRIEADRLCENGTIYDIYDYLQKRTMISDREKNIVLQEELMCEKEVLVPRKDVVDVMYNALRAGKTVNLISDMYLPQNILQEILESMGISGYSQLYISCEYKARKADKLFEKYLADNADRRCLHIGDNYFSDVVKPRQYGIDTYEVKSAYSMLKISNLHGILGCVDKINEKNMIGILISKIYNSPFALSNLWGVLEIREWEMFGYVFMAPLVIVYLIELINYLLAGREYDGILFAARDGYIFQHLYEKIRLEKTNLPPSWYFLTSRKASLRATMASEEMLDTLKEYAQDNESNEKWMEKYAGIPNVPNAFSNETLDAYVDRNKSYIYRKAFVSKKNYELYMKNEGIRQDGKYLFCEVYSRGTTQNALNCLFINKLDGFYLMRYYFEKNYQIAITAVYDVGPLEKETNMLMLHETLIELFLTSQDSALQEIGEEGEPIFETEQRSLIELQNIKQAWNGIESFFDRYMNIYIEGESIKKELPENLFMYLEDVVYDGQCKDIKDMRFFDNMIEGWRDARIFMK